MFFLVEKAEYAFCEVERSSSESFAISMRFLARSKANLTFPSFAKAENYHPSMASIFVIGNDEAKKALISEPIENVRTPDLFDNLLFIASQERKWAAESANEVESLEMPIQ
jgi:hypothetical protein